MLQGPGARAHKLLIEILVGAMSAASVVAQQGASSPVAAPVAAMFSADQKRDVARAPSFHQAELPATKTASFPVRLYLSAGDLERAFDRPEFRPDAAIVPTNTDLMIAAPMPNTQRILIDRVRKQSGVMSDLEAQIAARRKDPPAASGEPGLLRIGLDSFVAQLPRGATGQAAGAFPRNVCLIATDYAKGGAIDRRELFGQDRLRKGIAACLAALDAAGAQTLVLPLTGAASSGTQSNDAMFEGQRVLMECRLINATAGIALGIHDFASSRRSLREIGVVQWDQEIDRMFKVAAGSRAAQSAQAAHRAYADQVSAAFRRGLAGEKTTSSEISGTCNAILNVK